MIVTAVIHCGGKGTRLKSLAKKIPKPMVRISRRPLLFWHIQALKKAGIRNIFITLHYLPEIIRDYLGNGEEFGVSVEYSYKKELLGTGGALVPLLKSLSSDTLIIYGDVLASIDYKKLLEFHEQHRGLFTVVVHRSTHPRDSDLVYFDNNFKLQQITRKPHNVKSGEHFSLAAIFLIRPEAFAYFNLKLPFSLEDVLVTLIKKKKEVFCYNTDEFVMDIGTPQRLKKARSLKLV